jgi:hypothetical protein
MEEGTRKVKGNDEREKEEERMKGRGKRFNSIKLQLCKYSCNRCMLELVVQYDSSFFSS